MKLRTLFSILLGMYVGALATLASKAFEDNRIIIWIIIVGIWIGIQAFYMRAVYKDLELECILNRLKDIDDVKRYIQKSPTIR